MRISPDTKLDFDDVLIVPQRSTLKSRADVNVLRNFKFKHSTTTVDGFPIISANMDSTGTFAMAKKFAEYKAFTALHKFYEIDRLVDFFVNNRDIWKYVFYTVGANENDFEKLKEVKNRIINNMGLGVGIRFPTMLNLDAANGYTELFSDYLKRLREDNENSVIMAGNVVTPNMTEELILNGADIAKIGIGGGGHCFTRKVTGVGFPQLSAISECSFASHGLCGHIVGDGGVRMEGDICKGICAGCFEENQIVITDSGRKKIVDIEVGDSVITHKLRFKKVVKKLKKYHKGKLININGIKCTPNHHFYVLNKKYKNIVNEENIKDYAEWKRADEIDKHIYMLIKNNN